MKKTDDTPVTPATPAPPPPGLPLWAEEMRELFRGGSVAQFILHGNVFDVIPHAGERALSLPGFLDRVMFGGYDVVLHYDRGKGIRATRGGEEWGRWLSDALGAEAAASPQLREPGPALELIDRFLLRTLNVRALNLERSTAPGRVAVVINFAEFVAPRGDALALGSAFSANIVKILSWANDPSILRSNIATVLITEGLGDLSDLVRENPHAARLHVPLPDEPAMRDYVAWLTAHDLPDLPARCEVSPEVLAGRMTGLSRVAVHRALATAMGGGGKVTAAWLTRIKKESIERECQGLLEFLESPYTLDDVAGHEPIKEWLRQDTQLLKRGVLRALPMGYLIAGRIGTGKTFIVRCWAGELGIPCVVLKNFRDRWVGATESNLEKIFAILRALGQVVVFVDEADQITGKRGGGQDDSGLSGRVYGMLAAEMSNTANRGKIIWVFATSRPDLLEVDLKRQGRLDVHIPLFPPQSEEEVRALMLAIARKLRIEMKPDDFPALPEGLTLGANEIEGALVRALRGHELAAEPRPPLRDILSGVLKELRPSPHTRKLEYMDLIAVKECTDARFLPPPYRDMTPEQIESRLAELARFV